VPTLDLDADLVGMLALVGAVAAVLALLLAVAAHLRVRRLRRANERFWAASSSDDVAAVVAQEVEEVRRLRAEVETCRAEVRRLQRAVAEAVRHVAVVRYDAFGDMGGRLSFSAAFLDDVGDGLVLTSINGRSETRTYAKGVRGGSSDQTLSPEEEQVLRHALRRAAQD
jgi:uncharacterized protein YlxW (UPF0749 family)